MFFFGGHQEAWQIVGHGCSGQIENLQKLRAKASHPYLYHRHEHCAPDFTQIVMTGVQEDVLDLNKPITYELATFQCLAQKADASRFPHYQPLSCGSSYDHHNYITEVGECLPVETEILDL